MQTRAIMSVLAIMGSTAIPAAAETVYPQEMNRADIAGAMFERANTVRSPDQDGSEILDTTSLLSSDGKFSSGMYRAGKSRYEIDEPYGVDEFMYFLEGGVTMTSADGTVHVIEAGEAVTVPKEWTGIWETDGYTKIWVIYSADGSAFE